MEVIGEVWAGLAEFESSGEVVRGAGSHEHRGEPREAERSEPRATAEGVQGGRAAGISAADSAVAPRNSEAKTRSEAENMQVRSVGKGGGVCANDAESDALRKREMIPTQSGGDSETPGGCLSAQYIRWRCAANRPEIVATAARQ